MPGYVKCLFDNCECGNRIEYDPNETLLWHYHKTKTRTELIQKAKEKGVSDNPHAESTWILAYKLADLSKVSIA